MIAKLFLQITIYLAAMGALLFAAAGTLRWPGAWAVLVASALLGPAAGLWLARINPGLLEERLRPVVQKGQPAADKAFMAAFVFAVLIWIVVMGLEQRLSPPDVPVVLRALGFVLVLSSTVFILWVFRENPFAAPVVKVQAERGHRVVSSGPYAYVRHPMYGAIILFCVGVPLVAGSWWGLMMVPLFVTLLAVRAGIEERALIDGLPGYADYAARVRYRLVPGLW